MNLNIIKNLILSTAILFCISTTITFAANNNASEDNAWIDISDTMPLGNTNDDAFNSLAIYNNKLYTVHSNTVFQFNDNITKPNWTTLSDNSADASGVYALLPFNNSLYVGGDNFATYIDGKGWTSLSRNGIPNKDPIIKLVLLNGNIVALTRKFMISRSLLYTYDIKKNAWTSLNFDTFARNDNHLDDMVVFNNKLYAYGRNDDDNNKDLKAIVYVYNPATAKWKLVSNGLPYSVDSIAVYKNKLYVGGYSFINKKPFISTYNGNDDAPRWVEINTDTLPTTDDDHSHGFCYGNPVENLVVINNTLYASGRSDGCNLYIAALDDKNTSAWNVVGKKIAPQYSFQNMTSLVEFNSNLYSSITSFNSDNHFAKIETVYALPIRK